MLNKSALKLSILISIFLRKYLCNIRNIRHVLFISYFLSLSLFLHCWLALTDTETVGVKSTLNADKAIANHFLRNHIPAGDSRFLWSHIKKKHQPVYLYAINLWTTRQRTGRGEQDFAGATGEGWQEAWLKIELSNHGWSQRTFVRGAQTNLQTVALRGGGSPSVIVPTLVSCEDRRRQARWRRTRAFSWWSPRCLSSKFHQGRPTGVIGKRKTPLQRDVSRDCSICYERPIRNFSLRWPLE